MRLYRVTALNHTEATWAGTQAEVSQRKKELTDLGIKRKDISAEDVEVPMNKADLIGWLNANCKHTDDICDVTSVED